MIRNSLKNIPKIILFTDENNFINPITLAKYIPINWGLLIRSYNLTNRKNIITEAAKICIKRKIFFIIANDLKMAISLKASGLHLSEYFRKNINISTILIHKKKLILTTSIHDFYGLNSLNIFKPDFIFLSPINKTESHPNIKPMGIFPFLALSKKTPSPTYALGGININNYNRLMNFQISGIAGITLSSNIIQNFNRTPTRAPV